MKHISVLLLAISSLTMASTIDEGDQLVSDRIDFSSARIMGQQNDFGAVYLTHRKHNELNSLLSIRSNFRQEILFELNYQPLDETTGKPIEPAKYGLEGYEAGFEPVGYGQQ